MSFLRNAQQATKSLIYDVVDQANYRGSGMDQNATWFFGNDGVDYRFSFNTHADAVKAYKDCPPISSIINQEAQAYINGRTRLMDSKSSAAKGKQADNLRALLARPNALQTWKQFEAQSYIYQQLFGFSVILPIKPFGFSNADATALWNIPPFLLTIKESSKLYFKDSKDVISSITMTYKGAKTELDVSSVHIIKDFTPSFSSIVIPESRVKGVAIAINNIIGAYESRNVLINYRGALGILSPDGHDAIGPIALDPKAKEQIQSDFRQYGLK